MAHLTWRSHQRCQRLLVGDRKAISARPVTTQSDFVIERGRKATTGHPVQHHDTDFRDSRMSSISRQCSVLLGPGRFGRRRSSPSRRWSWSRPCGRAIRRSCQVGLQQRLRSSRYRHTGQPAQLVKLGGQGIELFVVCAPQTGSYYVCPAQSRYEGRHESAAAGRRPPFPLGTGYRLVVLVVTLVR
jgi:hypothetical protein